MAWFDLWCCGRRNPPGIAAKSKLGPLALESGEAPVVVRDPVPRQSWINATIEHEVDLADSTRRTTRVGSVSNVISLADTPNPTVESSNGRKTLQVPSDPIRGSQPQSACEDFGIGPQLLLIPDNGRKTLQVPSDPIRGSQPQSACEDLGIGPQLLLIPDDIPNRQSTRSRNSTMGDIGAGRTSIVSTSGDPILQETVEDLQPHTRRRTLSGTSVTFAEVTPSRRGSNARNDFGIAQVEEKVEVLNAGVRRTTRKSTVSSVRSLHAIREAPEEVQASAHSGGDFGIELNSAEEVARELQELERQVEEVALKEKVKRLTTIRYEVKSKKPIETRRNSAPALLRAVTEARQTEAARKRERAKTTIRFADENGGTINFAELAALAAEEDDDDDDDYDDEAEKAKMAAAMRSRTHTVNHSEATSASRSFERRPRFQTVSANSLKPRGSISGPVNPFVVALNGGGGRHTTYSTSKTSKELSEILKLVPLKKLKIVESVQEWDEDDDDKENASPEKLYEDAREKSQAREKRLTFACAALEQEQPMGDAEMEVVTAKKEWIGDDSDEEVDDKQFEESIVNKRETRRTVAQGELMKEHVVADAEVEVVPAMREWAEADSDDDMDQTKRAFEINQAREKRLTVAEAVLQLNQVVPDAEVEVMEEDQEWTGGGELDDDNDGRIEREKAASSAFKAREKRLTVAVDELQKDIQLADAELAVKTEEKEWVADLDSDDDLDEKAVEKQRKRRNSDCFNAREMRLTIAAEELKKESIVADTELEVKTEFKEWGAVAESDEEVEQVREKRNHQAFEMREKRLTMATEMLDSEAMLGDAEMNVTEEAKEWGGDDSDEDGKAFDKLATRASVSYHAREKRITMAILKLEQEGWMHEDDEVLEKRISAEDGIAYTKQEFLDYFGEEDGLRRWQSSQKAENGH